MRRALFFVLAFAGVIACETMSEKQHLRHEVLRRAGGADPSTPAGPPGPFRCMPYCYALCDERPNREECRTSCATRCGWDAGAPR